MAWNDLSERWKNYFVKQLHNTAGMSKDANTKVGCLIIDTKNKVVVSSGWNDLPRGVKHTRDRNTRPMKYLYTSHAEMSCLTNALRLRANVQDCTMLVTLACCPACACSVVNSGVSEVVTPAPDFKRETYGEDFKHTKMILQEGGLDWVYDETLIPMTEVDLRQRMSEIARVARLPTYSHPQAFGALTHIYRLTGESGVTE